jgi:hypothetical protein
MPGADHPIAAQEEPRKQEEVAVAVAVPEDEGGRDNDVDCENAGEYDLEDLQEEKERIHEEDGRGVR